MSTDESVPAIECYLSEYLASTQTPAAFAQKLVDWVATVTQLDPDKDELPNVDDWQRSAEKLVMPLYVCVRERDARVQKLEAAIRDAACWLEKYRRGDGEQMNPKINVTTVHTKKGTLLGMWRVEVDAFPPLERLFSDPEKAQDYARSLEALYLYRSTAEDRKGV